MNRRRTILTVAAGAALALTVATTVATTAAAYTPAKPKTLNVISTTLVQDGPAVATTGARYSFYDADSGDAQGHDFWDCVVTNPQGDGVCHGIFILDQGSISAETEGNFAAPTFQATGTITGGTGIYTGAHGTIVANGTLAVTPFTFYFAS